ncbi:clarin-1 [Cottoperca gobio]|uniref:Clarin-1 n=1 Tax=Cottoperca gobio TaxID=56716 RepID=A0A6J2QYH4_COTGO|nr:clarin-1 [Cottoperca gobio]
MVRCLVLSSSSSTSSPSVGLHVSVIFFCGAVILFSSVATGLFFFNAFGRPYETLQGPMGLYLWTFICCVCSCLVMILFASEVNFNHLSNRIANFNEVNFVYQTYTERYDRCFWLFFLVFLLHALNFLLIRLAGIQFPFRESKESDLSGGAADLMY